MNQNFKAAGKKLSFFLFLFSFKSGVGQVTSTTVWLALQSQVEISRKWEWVNDAGYRTIAVSPSAYGYHYRTGIRFKLNETWSLATGSAFFFTRSSYLKNNHEFGREFRLWQELGIHKSFPVLFSLHNRFRTEERWFGPLTNRDAFFGLRLRDRLVFIKPLTKKWRIEFGEEYLRMLSNHKFSFNSNKILLMTAYKMDAETEIQGGYIWLKLPVSFQHVFTLTLQKNFSLLKNKNHTELRI